MSILKYYSTTLFLLFISISVIAQDDKVVDEMEKIHKECISIKPDSNECSRRFLFQMDSMLNVVFENAISQKTTNEKTKIIKDQLSWGKKKNEFFKKQDETFVFNLKDGIWTKDMIRITYQQKADYIIKRIRYLFKKFID